MLWGDLGIKYKGQQRVVGRSFWGPKSRRMQFLRTLGDTRSYSSLGWFVRWPMYILIISFTSSSTALRGLYSYCSQHWEDCIYVLSLLNIAVHLHIGIRMELVVMSNTCKILLYFGVYWFQLSSLIFSPCFPVLCEPFNLPGESIFCKKIDSNCILKRD